MHCSMWWHESPTHNSNYLGHLSSGWHCNLQHRYKTCSWHIPYLPKYNTISQLKFSGKCIHTRCLMLCLIIRWQLYLPTDELGKISCLIFQYIQHNLHNVFWGDRSQLPAIAATVLLHASFTVFSTSLCYQSLGFFYLAPDSHTF